MKQDPVRRRYKHEWEKAIHALERAARGRDRGPALLEAARARYALYRFSSDEADRDRALSLARKASSAGARDAATFIAAVRREAGDDAPAHRTPAAPRQQDRALAKKGGASAPARKGSAADRRAAPADSAHAAATPPLHPGAPLTSADGVDEPPDTDPVLDRILAQLAEEPSDERADEPGELARAIGALREGGVPHAPAAAAPPSAGAAAPADAAPATAHAPPSTTHAPASTPPPSSATAALPSREPAPDVHGLLGGTAGALAADEETRSGPIRKIVIDPGHGGHDPGAIGPTRVREKDVVLAIARRLAKKLEQEGFEAVLTRDDDRYLALAERTALANAHDGDLFVSLHANAHPRRNREGVETWVLDVSSDRYATRLAARENGILDDADGPMDVRRILADLDAKVSAQASRRLARVVQQEVTSGIRSRFGDVRDLGVKSALFYVLLGARMPAVLVETSFISNRAEEKRLASPRFQDEVASALTRAINSFAAQQARIAAR